MIFVLENQNIISLKLWDDPGGCINGGGQSYVNAMIRNSGFDFKGARCKTLYDEDRAMPCKKIS